MTQYFILKSQYKLDYQTYQKANMRFITIGNYGSDKHFQWTDPEHIIIGWEGQVFEPGLAYTNFLLSNTGLYLTRKEVRDFIDNGDSTELDRKFQKYGHFVNDPTPIRLHRIKP